MKTKILLSLAALLALTASAMADNSVYNSKASTGLIPAPRQASAVAAVSEFDGLRANSKVQTVARAVPVIKTERSTTCSKPMASEVCKAHCAK